MSQQIARTRISGYNGENGVVTDANGLIYIRARYYSPEMKRFVNKDPLPYSYYTAPWESEADAYGGVNPKARDNSDPWTSSDGYYDFKDLIQEIFK